jgi:ParB family chromosome partitioning protein
LEIRHVDLGGIAILPDRMRTLRQEVVDQLAASMVQMQNGGETSGLLQPIVLRPKEGIGYYLVAGKHRYYAAKKLGWEAIPARIVEGMDADHVLLAEIDENLVRAKLTTAEEAAHHAARKEVYERLYPQTRRAVRRVRAGARRSAHKKPKLGLM